MKVLTRSILTAAGLARTSLALATYTPITSGPTYSVAIPSGSSISSSSTGPIYFSLSAPSSYQWVGLGIGEQMANSHIFVMYANGNNNVTISARDGGVGHVEPTFDSTLMAGVELLEGSGISNGVMTANVRCTTCTLLSSATSSSSPWICAWNTGSAIDSTSETFTLDQHGPNSMRQFTFDLSAASISSDSNPFVSSSSTSTTTSSSPSSSASSGSSSGSGSGSGSGSNSGSSSGSSGSSTTSVSVNLVEDYRKAHGIIMGVAVVLLFPIGAMMMRVVGNAWVHGLFQIFSLCALLGGFGVGVKLAKSLDYLYESTGKLHTIFGTVIIGLFLIQPFLGVLHHNSYKKSGGRTPVSHLHIWYGRIIMALGIVNGGLGLKLADNTKGGKIAYIAVAGAVGAVYILTTILKRKSGSQFGRRRKIERDISS